MDSYKHGVTAMHIPTRPRTHNRLRPSRSPSPSSSDSCSTRGPMAIPGVRYDAVPPPLPPPRYNDELDLGVDLAWKWGNQNHHSEHTVSRLAPIKAGSSLYGSYLQSSAESYRSVDRDGMGFNDNDEFASRRRGSNVSTVRSPSIADLKAGASLPSLVRKPPSPVSSNQRLQGERPLAQENFSRSSHAYDQSLLSKIGKPSSPPRHIRTESGDNTNLAGKPFLPSRSTDLNFQSRRPDSAEVPPSFLESTNRWVGSPTTAGLPSTSGPSWRESNINLHDQTIDSATSSLVQDPEWSLHARDSGITSTSGLYPGNEDSAGFTSRSSRNSHDPTVYVDSEPGMADSHGAVVRSFHSSVIRQHVEQGSAKQGVKRRALSPPAEMARDDKPIAYSSELYHRVTSPHLSAAYSPSPVARHNPNFGSVSSTASSIRQDSHNSSITPSIAGSSMTSVSSVERNSPSDPPHHHAFVTSAPKVLHSVTSAPLSERYPETKTTESKTIPLKMSLQTAVNDLRPPPAKRIGNYYICDCCPKKPKKYERIDDLRAHQMEKQYTCQYCNNRFKNKNEAERHQNSLHLRRHSWSCAAITSYEAAFHASSSSTTSTNSSAACAFCGEEFPNHPQPDWERRVEHLINVHKFGECNQSKKFFRADHFRQHLKHSHAGQSGKWTNLLESICLQEEPMVDGSGISPTSSEGRGSSSLPTPTDVSMSGTTIDEDQDGS